MTEPKGKRILIVGPAWIGDMVMAQSLFMTIKQNNPDAMIDVLAPQWCVDLLSRMPEVNKSIVMTVGHGEFGFFARRKLGISLRNVNYHQAIITPRSFKSALVPVFAKIPVRTGYRGEHRYGLINDMRQLNKALLTQTVQRYVALGLNHDSTVSAPPIPYPRLSVENSNAQRLVKKLNLDISKPVIAILPGAEYGPAKQWPADYYAELSKQLSGHGYQVWQLGSPKETVLGDQISAMSNAASTNLCGKTSLRDVIDLLSMVTMVISNDSGLMHIAAAVGCKVVAIYGSSTPAYTPPLTDKASTQYLNLECSPCFKRTCPLGHTRCLKEITVERVKNSVLALAGQSPL